MRCPDGVYGFVGDGVRSDYQSVNNSGLALGSPTDSFGRNCLGPFGYLPTNVKVGGEGLYKQQ